MHYTPMVHNAYEHKENYIISQFLNDECKKIKTSQTSLIQLFANNQIGFDLGDEFIIKNHASVNDKKFSVGKCNYDVLVIPETMENILDSTLIILENYLKAGGELYQSLIL